MAIFDHNLGSLEGQPVLLRLYKFAGLLTGSDKTAKALLKASFTTSKPLPQIKSRESFIAALARLYAVWNTKQSGGDMFAAGAGESRQSDPFSIGAAEFGRFSKFLSGLPVPQRAALYLVYGEGTSYDEAAEVLSLNMLSLMKSLTRGHLALSYWLDQQAAASREDKTQRAYASDLSADYFDAAEQAA
jgi:RNA polymerase sigma-70 factor (ECF subfamily)